MSESDDHKVQGGCLCGLIRYEVASIGSRMGHCHCSMCRKFHGAAFATLGEAKVEDFRWLSGEQHLRSFVAPNGTTRKFCEHCGSSLIFAPANDTGELVEFSLGTLDSDIELRPDAHIFTRFGASWYEIADNLPRYVEGRDSERER